MASRLFLGIQQSLFIPINLPACEGKRNLLIHAGSIKRQLFAQKMFILSTEVLADVDMVLAPSLPEACACCTQHQMMAS